MSTIPAQQDTPDVVAESSVRVFLWLLSWSTLWYFVERGIISAFRRKWPHIYQNLVDHGKATTFFAFAMGTLVTILLTPVCATAYYNSDAGPPLNFASPGAAEYCLAGRGILWMQEFVRIGHYNLVLLHHLGSLGVLYFVLAASLPAKSLYVLYATLISEIGIEITWMARALGYRSDNSLWFRRYQQFTLAGILAARWPAVIITLRETTSVPMSLTQRVVTNISTLIYACYFTWGVVVKAQRWKLIPVDSTKHFLPSMRRTLRSSTSTVLRIGTGAIPACLSLVYLYGRWNTRLGSDAVEWKTLGRVLSRSIVSSFVGSRVSSVAGESLSDMLSHGSYFRALSQPRFDAMGAVLGSALALFYSPELPLHTRLDLIAAVLIALPVYESISQAVSKRPSLTQITSENLLRSGAFFVPWLVIITLLFATVIDIRQAGLLSLFAHGCVHFMTERKSDIYGAGVQEKQEKASSAGGDEKRKMALPILLSIMEALVALCFLTVLRERDLGWDSPTGKGLGMKVEHSVGTQDYLAASILSMGVCYTLNHLPL